MGRNAEITRSFYEAFNRRDWEALAAHLAPGVEWFHASRGELICGREAVTALLRSSAEAFPEARVSVNAVHESGATVVTEWIYVSPRMQVSMKQSMACDIKQLRQGKLIRGATYGDTLQMLLGLEAPTPEAAGVTADGGVAGAGGVAAAAAGSVAAAAAASVSASADGSAPASELAAPAAPPLARSIIPAAPSAPVIRFRAA